MDLPTQWQHSSYKELHTTSSKCSLSRTCKKEYAFKTLKETGNVLELVSRKLEKAQENEFQEVSYGFFPSGYTVDKVYIMYYTNHIQSETGKSPVL